MDLNAYIEQGISSIAAAISNFYISESTKSDFLSALVPPLMASTERRKNFEKNGKHIPPFLIASITSKCNLCCAGCYARAGGMCAEHHEEKELSADEWKRVLSEASELGVAFTLLAGGEPLLRRDIISMAAELPNMIFPIFTNGTLLDGNYLDLFDKNRNLIPVFSIEGDSEETDQRRGEGVSKNIESAMTGMHSRGILYAASITVTNRNLGAVVTKDFLKNLRSKGCGAVFFVEYVPAEQGTEGLVLSDEETEKLNEKVAGFKTEFSDMNIFAFPGDEKYMGGCLAAGRGFFHINPFGAAEPCPFSPFSKMNVRECSVPEILESAFFEEIRAISKESAEHHSGGCTLFNHEDEVRALLIKQNM